MTPMSFLHSDLFETETLEKWQRARMVIARGMRKLDPYGTYGREAAKCVLRANSLMRKWPGSVTIYSCFKTAEARHIKKLNHPATFKD